MSLQLLCWINVGMSFYGFLKSNPKSPREKNKKNVPMSVSCLPRVRAASPKASAKESGTWQSRIKGVATGPHGLRFVRGEKPSYPDPPAFSRALRLDSRTLPLPMRSTLDGSTPLGPWTLPLWDWRAGDPHCIPHAQGTGRNTLPLRRGFTTKTTHDKHALCLGPDGRWELQLTRLKQIFNPGRPLFTTKTPDTRASHTRLRPAELTGPHGQTKVNQEFMFLKLATCSANGLSGHGLT
jgi:hypothetical protein